MQTVQPIFRAIVAAVCFFGTCLGLQSQEFTARPLAGGLEVPWEILYGPDAHIWVTERPGRVVRIDPQNGEVKPLATIADATSVGESGLLGMQVLSGFSQDLTVFLAYTYVENGFELKLRIERYTFVPGVDGEEDRLIDPVVLLEDIPGAQIHDGCRLLLSQDNLYLFATTGDAGSSAMAQNLESLNGKTLRMYLDGSVPEDNPFPNSLIWSYGHRNAQGLDWGPNGELYSSEHGHTTDDEFNIITRGGNFGWRDVQGFCDEPFEQNFCDQNDIVEPLMIWTPTVAPCGITYYNSDHLPALKHSVIMTTLKERRLIALHLSEDGKQVESTTELFANEYGRIRDVCVSPDGRLFFATSNRDGRAQAGEAHEDDDRIMEVVNPTSAVDSSEPDNHGGLSLHPNPLVSECFIHAATPQDGVYTLQILDVLGRPLRTEEIESRDREIHWRWDGKDDRAVNLPRGTYLVVIGGKGGRLQSTLVKH